MTTCYDGSVRLYAVENKGLKLLMRTKIEGGKRPYSARFSPDGQCIAVGFDDTTVVQVLNADALSDAARPSTEGVDNGSLTDSCLVRRRVSSAGSGNLAGCDGRDKTACDAGPLGNWSRYEDVPVSADTIMGLSPLPGQEHAFCGGGSVLGRARR